MTDNEIVKALECCGKNPPICIECSYKGKCNRKDCYDYLKGDALTLIHRQQTKIEILSQKRANIFEISSAYERGRAEAIKKFTERLKAELRNVPRVEVGGYVYYLIGEGAIDNIAKETVGDSDA